MRIIAIDQSLRFTGTTLFEDGKPIEYRIITTEKDDGDVYTRINYITTQLSKYAMESNVDHIAIESIPLGRVVGNSRIDLAGLFHSIIQELKYRQGIELSIIAISDWKAHLTGKGNADKPLVWESLPEEVKESIIAVEKRKTMGRQDIADSYAIGNCLIKQLS